MKKLTLKEALEQGYTKFLFKGEKFQTLQELSDLEDRDYERGVELVNKEPEMISAYIDEEQLRELIAEHCEMQHADETGDDTEQVYDGLMDLPLELFAPIIAEVKRVNNSIGYYKSSGIELKQ